MTNWNPRANELFLQALEMRSPSERQKFLDGACGGDVALRAEVEGLLEASARVGGFLESPVTGSPPSFKEGEPQVRGGATDNVPSISEGPGAVIGPYKLLEQIGEGGFGVVFMAEQSQPMRRRVALKVLKPGMDTRQVVARFEAERQALAIMDHPNIAKVFDGGATASGRPYFVMELVRGVPITEYCDQSHLTPRQRLELFISVCQAVQHAHQKGIIHRDLKPSNVLVTMHAPPPPPLAKGGHGGVVKIIDFGVAKALGQVLTDKTLFTGFMQMIGTPLYMSPEQAGQTGLDVDTRSDIYALGVLLYELLTGTTPFKRERFKQAAYDEILRIIREEDPPKPSTRLSESEDSLPSISAQRQTEPARLTKLVRGELDWIVMKALEKDRERRYETANGFAIDVQRYLADEPVLAGPPSAWYKVRKFARRNRRQLVVLGVFALMLVAGTGAVIWQAVRATLAESHAKDSERAAREEAAIAKAVNDFLNNDLLGQANPEKSAKTDLKLRTVLDRASQKIDKRFADQPLVEAGIRMTLSNTYCVLGEYTLAERHGLRARQLYRELRGPDHPDTLRANLSLADVLQEQSRLDEADKVAEENVATARRILGAEHPDTLSAIHRLATVWYLKGRLPEALKLHQENLEIRRRVLGHEHADTLASMSNVAAALYVMGRYEEARQQYEESLRISLRTLGPDDHRTLTTMTNVAGCLTQTDRLDEARSLLDQAWKGQQRILGPEHRLTLSVRNTLANTLRSLGRLSEAAALAEETLQIWRRVHGLEHQDTITSMGLLGEILTAQGRLVEAAQLYEQRLQISRRVLGSEHPDTIVAMNGLGFVLLEQGRLREARPHMEMVLQVWKRDRGPESPLTLAGMCNMARLIHAEGRLEEARKLHEEVLQVRQRVMHPKHPHIQYSLVHLSLLLQDQGAGLRIMGRNAESLAAYRHAVANYARLVAEAPKHLYYRVELAHAYGELATDLSAAGNVREATEAYQNASTRFEKLAVDDKWQGDRKSGRSPAENEKTSESNAGKTAWHFLALARLGADDTAGYRQACASVLEQFAKVKKGEPVRLALWSCVVAPGAVTDYDKLLQHAERQLAEQPNDFVALSTFGAVLFRAGRHQAAIQRLKEAQAIHKPTDEQRHSIALNHCFLAMANHRLGNLEEARLYLNKVLQAVAQGPDATTAGAGAPWDRRLTLELLRREVVAESKRDSK